MAEPKVYADMDKQLNEWIVERNCKDCLINYEDCDMYLCFEVWKSNKEVEVE